MSFVKHSEPKISMPKAPRFKYERLEKKEEPSPTIDSLGQYGSVSQNRGVSIGTAKRSDFTKLKGAIETPGPGQYEVAKDYSTGSQGSPLR